MPSTPSSIVVDPAGYTAVVTIKKESSAGYVPTIYTTENGASALTMPATITSRTVFWVDTPGMYWVSATVNGVEAASRQGPVSFELLAGMSRSISTYSPVVGDPDSLASGEATFNRLYVAGTVTLSNQSVRLSFFTAKKTELVVSLRTATGATAAAATPTLCKMGLYSVAANGDLTLIGSTASTTTLWAATTTAYTTALTTPAQKSAGTQYAFAALCVTGTTAPVLIGSNSTLISTEAALAPRLNGVVASQSDLPATITAGTVTGSSGGIYGVCVP